MKRLIKYGFMLTILILPNVLAAGKTYYKSIPLKRIVQKARYIYLVEKAKPNWIVFQKLPVTYMGRKYPDYNRTIFRHKLRETLYSPGKPPFTAGAVIQVLDAYNNRKYGIHRAYQTKGIHKSPIYETYYGSNKRKSESRIIIFVNDGPDGFYQFSCESCYESTEKLAEIRRLISLKKKAMQPLKNK